MLPEKRRQGSPEKPLTGKAKDAAGRKAAGVAEKAADVAGAAKKRIDRAMGMEN